MQQLTAATCTNCAAGRYSSAGAEECTPCPLGKYGSVEGLAECTTLSRCHVGTGCPTGIQVGLGGFSDNPGLGCTAQYWGRSGYCSNTDNCLLSHHYTAPNGAYVGDYIRNSGWSTTLYKPTAAGAEECFGYCYDNDLSANTQSRFVQTVRHTYGYLGYSCYCYKAGSVQRSGYQTYQMNC